MFQLSTLDQSCRPSIHTGMIAARVPGSARAGFTTRVPSWRSTTFLIKFDALRRGPRANVGAAFVRAFQAEVGETFLLGSVLRTALEDIRMLDDGDAVVGAAARRFLRLVKEVGSPNQQRGAPTFNAAPHLPPRQLRDSEHKFVRYFERASADRGTLVALVHERAKLPDFVHDITLDRLRRLATVPSKVYAACADLAREQRLLAYAPRLPGDGTSLVCAFARVIPLAAVPRIGGALGSMLAPDTWRAAVRVSRAWNLLLLHAPGHKETTVRIGAGGLLTRDLLPESAGGRAAAPPMFPFRHARHFVLHADAHGSVTGVAPHGHDLLTCLPAEARSLVVGGTLGTHILRAMADAPRLTLLERLDLSSLAADPALVRNAFPNIKNLRRLAVWTLDLDKAALDWLGQAPRLEVLTVVGLLRWNDNYKTGTRGKHLRSLTSCRHLAQLTLPAQALSNELGAAVRKLLSCAPKRKGKRADLCIVDDGGTTSHSGTLRVRNLRLCGELRAWHHVDVSGIVAENHLIVSLPLNTRLGDALRVLRENYRKAVHVTIDVQRSHLATPLGALPMLPFADAPWTSLTLRFAREFPVRFWLGSHLGDNTARLFDERYGFTVGAAFPTESPKADLPMAEHLQHLVHAGWSRRGHITAKAEFVYYPELGPSALPSRTLRMYIRTPTMSETDRHHRTRKKKKKA